MTNEQRFLDKVLIPDDKRACWEWQAYKNKYGYGEFKIAYKTVLAHRVAFELYNGPIPEGLHVRHTCDNRGCVNPLHLLCGTHADNMRDRDMRGRNGHKNKTHCPKGHEYDEKNTYVYKNGRFCRACSRASGKARWARKKALRWQNII